MSENTVKARCAYCGHEIEPLPDVPPEMVGQFCVPLRNRKGLIGQCIGFPRQGNCNNCPVGASFGGVVDRKGVIVS